VSYTQGELKHFERVKSLSCCLCGSHPPTDAHHIKDGRTFGKRDRLSFTVIPLCKDCHTGKDGVHGNGNMLRLVKKDELELLSDTLKVLYG